MTRSGVLGCLFCAILAAAVSSIALARPGTVKTTDGHSYDGEIDDRNADFVIVTVRGIETRVVFGVRREGEDALSGHAWLEAGGETILEKTAPDYRVTYSFPN